MSLLFRVYGILLSSYRGKHMLESEKCLEEDGQDVVAPGTCPEMI